VEKVRKMMSKEVTKTVIKVATMEMVEGLPVASRRSTGSKTVR